MISKPLSICLEPADVFVNHYFEPPTWIWDEQLALGCMTLLIGAPKAGKSLFVRNLIAAISEGENFLGKATKKTSIAYLALEEHPSFLKATIQSCGLVKSFVHIHHGSVTEDQKELLTYLEKYVVDFKIELVVIDPLSKFTSLSDFNDYSKVYKACSPLTDFARRTNTHLMLVHHTNKGGSESPNQIMGSNGFFGVSDGAFFLSRSSNNQGTIKGNLRYGTGIENCAFSYDECGKLIFQGSVIQMKQSQLKSDIVEILNESGQHSISDFTEKLKVKRASLIEALNSMVETGQIEKSGAGTKSSPFKYVVPILNNLEREHYPEDLP